MRASSPKRVAESEAGFVALRAGADYGVERGVRAGFHKAHNYVILHGPQTTIVPLLRVEQEVIEQTKASIPDEDAVTVSIDPGNASSGQ